MKKFLVIARQDRNQRRIAHHIYTSADEKSLWKSIAYDQGVGYSNSDTVERLKQRIRAGNDSHGDFVRNCVAVFDVSEDDTSDFASREVLIADVIGRFFGGEARNVLLGDLRRVFELSECYVTELP